VRMGLWQSKNSIAVQVGRIAGVDNIIEEARKFGITAPIDAVPSIFLGTISVKPIELIAGYSVFANLGTHVVPNFILRVEDRNGKNIWPQQPTPPIPVLDPGVAFTMNQALVGVVRNGTGATPIYRAGFTVPAGGKTGTTSDYRDVWFVGFTKDLVAGV